MKKIYTLLLVNFWLFTAFAQTPINTNGNLETGDNTGWTLPTGVEVSALAAYNSSNYGIHINLTATKLDGMRSDGLQLEIGKTYVVEMWVKAITQTSNIALRLQPNAWSDAFKNVMTAPGSGSGLPTVLNTWTLIQFSKEITTDFSAGSSIGDKIDSRLHFQANNTNDLELYIDDLKIYEQVTTDISNKYNNKQIFFAGNTLFINNSSQEIYQIYNIGGSIIKQGEINSDAYTTNLNLPSGIYIVKVGNISTKITVQ